VPVVPDDYIHRVGRTARAEATGSAFTLVSPEEEESLRGIEKAIGNRLPRVTLPDFDYKASAPPPPPATHRPRRHHRAWPHHGDRHRPGSRSTRRSRGR